MTLKLFFMITESSNKEEILAAIEVDVTDINEQLIALDNTTIKQVLFEGSWTTAQLVRHT